MNYRRSYDVLRELPPVFSLREMELLTGQAYPVCRLALHRWRRRGWIKDLGPRTGVYFNLLKDPKAWGNYLPDALRKLFPGAVVIGPSVLHDHGWTTQIPQLLHVAVPARRSLPQLHGVHLVGRPRRWYRQVAPYLQPGSSGLPELPPAMALADCLRYRDSWVPDADDLELGEMSAQELATAARWLGTSPEAMAPYLEKTIEK